MLGLPKDSDYIRWKKDPNEGLDTLKQAPSDMVILQRALKQKRMMDMLVFGIKDDQHKLTHIIEIMRQYEDLESIIKNRNITRVTKKTWSPKR
jgi:hypothetical protein